jgi:hypothetical protein
MPDSPYIDADGSRQNRQVKSVSGSHVPYVTLEENFVSQNSIHTFKPIKSEQNSLVAVGGICNLNIDTRGYNFLFVRLENNSVAAWTDCIVRISALFGSGKWETIANGDYFYTTGQGELEGNAMKLIRKCSVVNPRTVAASGSTWILFYLAGIPQIQIAVTGTSMDYLYTLTQ